MHKSIGRHPVSFPRRPAAVAVLGALLLAGCGSMASNGYGVAPLTQGIELADDPKPAPTSSDTAAPPPKTKLEVQRLLVLITSAPKPILKPECVDAEGSGCQTSRNNAVATLMVASDDMCQQHLKSIFGNEAGSNITSGSIALLASGLATVSVGVDAKTGWAAISTLANAERSLINETVYKEKLVNVITSKIRQERDRRAALMVTHFHDTVTDYPVMLALSDLTKYHYTCSFMFGLEKALEEGMQSSNEVRRVKLEQERQQLINFLDVRAVQPNLDKTATEGAKERLQEIDKALKLLSSIDDMAAIKVAGGVLVARRADVAHAVAEIQTSDAQVKTITGALASKAKDKKLEKVTGLDTPHEGNQAVTQKAVIENCYSVLDNLQKIEQGELSVSGKADANKLDSARQKGEVIATLMKSLAVQYRIDVEAWNKELDNKLDAIIQAKTDRKTQITDFKGKLADVPRLNKDQLSALENVCKPQP